MMSSRGWEPENRMGPIGKEGSVKLDTLSDADVIQTSLEDPACFATIFDRHVDAVSEFVTRRVGVVLADDITAETFLTAFANRRRYDSARADARPWLLGIATNLLRHHWRTEKRRLAAYARIGAERDEELGVDTVEDRLDATALAPRMAWALQRLRKRDLEPLLLLAWADLSYSEISDALALPVGTVKSRIARARRRLRELMDGSGQFLGGDNTGSGG
jgi:RNA polymerase sigma factor (sigma-70 family)